MAGKSIERYINVKNVSGNADLFGSISPIFVGHSICENGHIYGPFRRKHFVFQYILSGNGTFESPYGAYHPSAGDMIIMHRGDLVNYGCYGKEPWECIWIEFDCNGPLPDVFNTGVIHSEELREIFLDLVKVNELSHGHGAYACSIIWRIIALLDTGKPKINNYSHYVNEAIRLIRKHYIQKITVSYLAEKLNLNRSYFCALFKKEVGMSPKEYIDDYRISAACEILKQSELSIGEVAENAGYSDLSSFSKAFKEKVGISPKAYREAYKPK